MPEHGFSVARSRQKDLSSNGIRIAKQCVHYCSTASIPQKVPGDSDMASHWRGTIQGRGHD